MSEITEKIEELTKVLMSDSATQDEKNKAFIKIGAISAISTLSKKQLDEMGNAVEIVRKSVEIAENLLKIFRI